MSARTPVAARVTQSPDSADNKQPTSKGESDEMYLSRSRDVLPVPPVRLEEEVTAAWASEMPRQPVCYGHCGFLGWTVAKHGRVTHKQSCPHRAEPWCQSHPEGCPDDCVPEMWKEWNERVNSYA